MGLVWFQEWIPKGHVFRRDQVPCSKYNNHSRCKSQHNWGGGLYDHLMRTRIFTLMMNNTFIEALEKRRKLSMASI